jgi:endonuclease YncB( thermonuclease family)
MTLAAIAGPVLIGIAEAVSALLLLKVFSGDFSSSAVQEYDAAYANVVKKNPSGWRATLSGIRAKLPALTPMNVLLSIIAIQQLDVIAWGGGFSPKNTHDNMQKSASSIRSAIIELSKLIDAKEYNGAAQLYYAILQEVGVLEDGFKTFNAQFWGQYGLKLDDVRAEINTFKAELTALAGQIPASILGFDPYQVPEKMRAHVIDVHDGDTVLVFAYPEGITRAPTEPLLGLTVETQMLLLEQGSKQYKVRLIGIDAPELMTPRGQIAQKYLESRLLGKDVTIVRYREQYMDRWKRVLAVVLLDNENINRALAVSGYAAIYPSERHDYIDQDEWKLAIQQQYAERVLGPLEKLKDDYTSGRAFLKDWYDAEKARLDQWKKEQIDKMRSEQSLDLEDAKDDYDNERAKLSASVSQQKSNLRAQLTAKQITPTQYSAALSALNTEYYKIRKELADAFRAKKVQISVPWKAETSKVSTSYAARLKELRAEYSSRKKDYADAYTESRRQIKDLGQLATLPQPAVKALTPPTLTPPPAALTPEQSAAISAAPALQAAPGAAPVSPAVPVAAPIMAPTGTQEFNVGDIVRYTFTRTDGTVYWERWKIVAVDAAAKQYVAEFLESSTPTGVPVGAQRVKSFADVSVSRGWAIFTIPFAPVVPTTPAAVVIAAPTAKFRVGTKLFVQNPNLTTFTWAVVRALDPGMMRYDIYDIFSTGWQRLDFSTAELAFVPGDAPLAAFLGRSAGDQAAAIFREILLREADPGGLAEYTAAMSGQRDPTRYLSQEQRVTWMRNDLRASGEYRSRGLTT